MSRVIRNDHPWDQSEVQYHLDRGLVADVEQNQKDWPPGSEHVEGEGNSDDGVVLELSQKVYEFVQGLDMDGLKGELRKAGIKPTGDETELKVKLAQHLQDLEDKQDANDA
jgi:hypothetical protein